MPTDYKDFQEAYNTASTSWAPWLRAALDDLRFYKGHQWSEAEKKYLADERREALVFNKIRRLINMITGFQRKHRLGFKVEGEDPDVASQLTGLLMYVMQRCNGYHVMSDAFETALRVGLSLVEIGIGFDNDPVFGDVSLVRVPITGYMLDPSMTKPDLSDCSYILRRTWVSKEDAQALFPDKAKDIEDWKPAGTDNMFYANITPEYKKKFKLDEYWRRETKKTHVVIDLDSGKWRTWPGDKETLDMLLERAPRLQAVQVYQAEIRLTSFIDGTVVYDGPNPVGTRDFPFVPVFYEFDFELPEFDNKVMGLVRILRDPQRELNKRMSKNVDILDSQITTGWLAEQGAVINQADLFRSGQGKVIFTEDGALADGRVRRIDPPQIPQGLFQLSEELNQTFTEISGVTNELLGSPDNENIQVAGFLAKMRQAAGLTTLQKFFDQYRLSKTMLGRKLLEAIQKNFTPQKVATILNKPANPKLYDPQVLTYNVDVAESVLSDSQRQIYYRELTTLKAMGAPIPWSALIQAAPIEHREKLMEAIQAEEQRLAQQAQLEQRARLIELQLAAAQQHYAMVAAQDRQAEAVRELAQAELARARAQEILQTLPLKKIERMEKINRGYITTR